MKTLYWGKDLKTGAIFKITADDDQEAKRKAATITSNPHSLTAFAYMTTIGRQFFAALGVKEREIGTAWIGDLHEAF